MNKKKIAILALLMVAVIVMTSCLLVACNPDGDSDGNANATIEPTEGLLISNSDFKVIDTSIKTYPRASTSWTGAKMYSDTSFRDDVTAGVISLKKDSYDTNKSNWEDDGELWNKLSAGGRAEPILDDGDENERYKNILMIYMPKTDENADGNDIYGPTAYGYTSASFSLEKSSYYRLSVDVLTYKIDGKRDSEDNLADGEKPGAR
ncbi:MAG: hypothetical protein NC179_01680, partial [[Eubacterium] siraeum]|nr:hypothetical protein [[Eubacterium] siraeum]